MLQGLNIPQGPVFLRFFVTEAMFSGLFASV